MVGHLPGMSGKFSLIFNIEEEVGRVRERKKLSFVLIFSIAWRILIKIVKFKVSRSQKKQPKTPKRSVKTILHFIGSIFSPASPPCL